MDSIPVQPADDHPRLHATTSQFADRRRHVFRDRKEKAKKTSWGGRIVAARPIDGNVNPP
ncbi:MAG: hypothetical protein EA424_14235 [Planctomycetaceae bacterium]|nr:MAG: hypothetical protein EA424_14235 [Planctomycetaceae bacterium]